MNWYSVALIFKAVIVADETQAVELCEQQIRLIRATDESAAQQKAQGLGQQAAHDYLNAEGQRVEWVFVGVEAVQEILGEGISDGVEVYSRYFDHATPEALIEAVLPAALQTL